MAENGRKWPKMAKNGQKWSHKGHDICKQSLLYLNEYFRVLVNAEGIVNSVESTLEKNCPIHKWKVFGKLGNLKADMFEECPISDILRFQYLFSQGLLELVILDHCIGKNHTIYLQH